FHLPVEGVPDLRSVEDQPPDRAPSFDDERPVRLHCPSSRSPGGTGRRGHLATPGPLWHRASVETPVLEFQPTMPVFIRRLADAEPGADLIVTANGRRSYGEREEWSRRLAKALLARGVGKGTRVAFM